MALIKLTDIPRRIAELSKDGTAPSYGQVYRAALSAVIPVLKIGSRYHIDEEKLFEVAEYFHVNLKPQSVARKRKAG